MRSKSSAPIVKNKKKGTMSPLHDPLHAESRETPRRKRWETHGGHNTQNSQNAALLVN